MHTLNINTYMTKKANKKKIKQTTYLVLLSPVYSHNPHHHFLYPNYSEMFLTILAAYKYSEVL